MLRLPSVTAVLFSTAILATTISAAEVEPAPVGKTVRVTQTFNDAAFEYQIKPLAKKSGFTVWRLTYPSPVRSKLEQNNIVPADYYLPDGIAPGQRRPAVICMHILDGDFTLVEMICTVLVSRGIPAIMFKLPYYGERGPEGGPRALAADPKLFAMAMNQAMADLRRTIDILESRPEVDPKHIGITGISLGGIVAATASGADPRLNRVFLMLAGGDLLKVIHHARETRLLSEMLGRIPEEERVAIQKQLNAVDPLGVAKNLKERAQAGRVMMINASDDEVIPPECSRRLADALGIADKVVWLDGLGHYTAMAELPRVMRMMGDFFAKDLPDDVAKIPGSTTKKKPTALLVSVLKQLATLATSEPPKGRCHFAKLALNVTPNGQQPAHSRLAVLRGDGNRFKIELELPSLAVGAVAVGQSEFPWMDRAGKIVFTGTENPGEKLLDPIKMADPEHGTKIRMAAGAAAGVAMAPDLLLRWITAEDVEHASGRRAIRIADKENPKSHGTLIFKEDGATPDRLEFAFDDAVGTLHFHAWQINTVSHPLLFEPPKNVPHHPVDQQDVYRMMTALFNFAMESIE